MENFAPQISTYPTPEPSKHRQLPWLAFVLSLLVLSVIGALAFQNLKLRKQLSSITSPLTGGSQVTPELLPSTPPSQMDTSNWKTYTNETNNYSIQYPSETYLRLACPNEELILQKRKGMGIYRNDIDPKIIQNTCARDFRYHLEIRTITNPKYLEIPKNSTEYSVETEKITLSGKTAIKYTVTARDQNEGPGPRWYQSVLVPQENTTMEIYFSDKENSILFDQILSTFQFTQ